MSRFLSGPAVRLEFHPRLFWVGVSWLRTVKICWVEWHVWVCLLPCLPLHVWWDVALEAERAALTLPGDDGNYEE